MADLIDSFKNLNKEASISENAKEFLAYPSLIDRTIAFRELCVLGGVKFTKDVQELDLILNGSLTRGIPLMAIGRFYTKYVGSFGKKFTYRKQEKLIKIGMSDIDIAFTVISGKLYNIYCRFVGNG